MSDRLLVATRKGLFDLRQRRQGRWEIAGRSFLGEPVSMMLRDPHDGALYTALSLGHFGAKLHRSDDDGVHWEEINAPSYTGIDCGENEAPSLKMIWSLEVGAAGTLWAGTIPGGVFKSTDRGVSWQLARNLWENPLRKQWFGGGYDEPGVHSICIDPRDTDRVAVAVSCGGIWLSDDGGDTWRVACEGMWADYMPPEQKDNPATQDPHRLVQCRGEPDCFWIQHHNGIFRSVDGCAHWTPVVATPSSFGFAVAVHPGRADCAWFVPAIRDAKRYPVDGRFVVTRTENGGKTFSVLDEGLPRVESYDLVYRHGLDIDDSGRHLAMGSTTGNLWISENGGERWSAFSSHLPPIYAVRFV